MAEPTVMTSLDREHVAAVSRNRFEWHMHQFFGGARERFSKPETATYSARHDASSAIDMLLALGGGRLEPAGEVLFAVEQVCYFDMVERMRDRPIADFDSLNPESNVTLSREAAVLDQAASILGDTEAGAAAQAQAKVRRAILVARKNVIEPLFHVKRPPYRQPSPLRVIGEALVGAYPDLEAGQLDELGARLFLDFLGSSPADEAAVGETARRLHDLLKPARRARK